MLEFNLLIIFGAFGVIGVTFLITLLMFAFFGIIDIFTWKESEKYDILVSEENN